MQELDADGNGSITFLEFMVSASRVLFGGRSVAEAKKRMAKKKQTKSV